MSSPDAWAPHVCAALAAAAGLLGAAYVNASVQPAAATARGDHADLMLIHGRIYTVDSAHPWAQAIGVHGNTIGAVGTDADVLRLKAAATRVIDLQGRLVTPGFIDSHVHFTDGGFYLRNVALRDAETLAEITQRIARYAQEHPEEDWIQGEGWSYGYPDLPHGEFHKEMLDAVALERPVFLDSR